MNATCIKCLLAQIRMTHAHTGPRHRVKGFADKIDGGHADLQEEGQLDGVHAEGVLEEGQGVSLLLP